MYPVYLSRRATIGEFKLGKSVILPKEKFYSDYYEPAKAKSGGADNHDGHLISGWEEVADKADHFILVPLSGFELQKGQARGRVVANIFLNVLRLFMGLYHCEGLRLAGDFEFRERGAHLIIQEGPQLYISTSYAWRGTHASEEWFEKFKKECAPVKFMVGTLCDLIASGDMPDSPAVKRIEYAHVLLAEAYSEPNDLIRVVRLCGALEALALISGTAKKHALATLSAHAASYGDEQYYSEVFQRVTKLYDIRNSVVHGDYPSDSSARGAFERIDPYLFLVIMRLTARIVICHNQDNPKSVRILRKKAKQRTIEVFGPSPVQPREEQASRSTLSILRALFERFKAAKE